MLLLDKQYPSYPEKILQEVLLKVCKKFKVNINSIYRLLLDHEGFIVDPLFDVSGLWLSKVLNALLSNITPKNLSKCFTKALSIGIAR